MKTITRASVVMCVLVVFFILTVGTGLCYGEAGLKALGAAIAIAETTGVHNEWTMIALNLLV